MISVGLTLHEAEKKDGTNAPAGALWYLYSPDVDQGGDGVDQVGENVCCSSRVPWVLSQPSESVGETADLSDLPDMTFGLALQQLPGWVPETSQCLEIGWHSPSRMMEGKMKFTPTWITIDAQMTMQ